ncbi:hypothetical protein T484DRAFT_1789870 [Baffinella frigidus]|nr:hypothetical protein T484DRAFT_1789870 [Cryptophyta sp. CCMP2293]
MFPDESRYAPGADPTGWEFNMIIALKILKAMARSMPTVVEWRKSASDVVPPDWLLKGVTSLVVQLMSLKEGGDGVKVCCLELGVSLLHGGDNYFQKAFLDNFEKKGGAPEFFEEVQRRLRSATEEDRRAKIAQLNPQLQRTSEQMIATRYRALHTLVVQAAREGENSTNSYVEATT